MNPDGGFPVNMGNLPPANPTNPLRAAFKTNDLRTWAPMAPTLLCAGNSDPVVFYMNTQLIQSYFGMTSSSAPVTVLDIDSPVEGVNDRFAMPKRIFAAAKADVADAAVSQGASDGGASTARAMDDLAAHRKATECSLEVCNWARAPYSPIDDHSLVAGTLAGR